MSTRFVCAVFQTEVIRKLILIFITAVFMLTTGCSSEGDTASGAKQTDEKNASLVTDTTTAGTEQTAEPTTTPTTEPSAVGQESTKDTISSANPDNVIDAPIAEIFPDIDRKPRHIENKFGIYYEIFVRSFADSDGDGTGDIKGMTSKLDYLNDGNAETDSDLGINGIYLMPVNVSPSYHKYDVTNYYDIDPEYGTLEDFELFLQEAHKRGIRVIMDLVINHTSSEHPWFKEASGSAGSPYRDYYNWANEDTEGYDVKGLLSSGNKIWHSLDGSYYFGYFWSGMPDLNYDNPAVRQEIKKVVRFWLEKGVDGFRLDAAMHIYGMYEKPVGTRLQEKNIQWWKEFGAYAEQINPEVYLVGEVWEKTYAIAPYYEGLDSLFNFDIGEGIVKIIQSGSAAAVNSKGFSQWLAAKYETYEKTEPEFLDAPFLTNHDQNRIMDRLRGDTAKAGLAASIYLTLPGNPFIYYGEEIGMAGSKPDEMIRVPFIWFEETKPPQCAWESTLNNISTVPQEIQSMDPGSLLTHYKRLISVRQSSNALMRGGFRAVDTGSRAVVAYERFWPGNADHKGSKDETGAADEADSVIVLHNLSSEVQRVSFDIKLNNAVVIFNSTGVDDNAAKKAELTEIQPYSTIIIDAG